MFSTIKAYIYGAIAAIGLIFVAWFQYLRNKTAKQEQEITNLKQGALATEEAKNVREEIKAAESSGANESDSDIDKFLLDNYTRNKD